MNLAATSLPLTTDISTSVYSRSSPQTDLLQLDKAGLHSVTSLLFIDSAVKDYQSLVAEVRPETEVHVLDSSQDAIRQITQVLLGREGISSLHIVSHGESGKLGFGSSQLNSTDLPEYTQSLRSWGKSLTDDADILLYGCDIAQGEIGQSFIQQFAQLTGADIAASDDLTGSAALGGNWTLEVNTGDIAASLVFQASAIASVAITVTPVNDAPTWTGNATLAAVTQNTTNPSGSSLSSLFGSLFNDIDANASLSGLAIVGNPSTSTQGQWQYSINGTTWTNVGTVAEGATALALSADTLIRFVPAIGYSGTPPGLTVRALDNTYGSRGFTTGTTRVTVNTTSNGSTTAISGGTPATLNTSVTKSLPNLLWRNSGSGENAVWQLNSFALQSSYYLPAVDPSWQIASSTADFNHDGIADILWRNQVTGQNAIWEMNSTGLQSGSFITQVADLNWQIAGTGDFDGDKKSDILWRNRVSGQNAIWQMNGVALKSGDFITQVADLNWQIVGTGDFNGDGKSDLVWRNRASGANAIWQMNGATLKSGDFITQVADTNWQIVGIGDFNGDGKSDLVWRNRASGQNAIWQMDGATLQSGIFITSLADTNWEIAGVADLGSDSTPEIVWRNKQAGKAMIWQLSSFSDAQTYKLVDVIDPKWSVKPFAADLETAVSSG